VLSLKNMHKNWNSLATFDESLRYKISTKYLWNGLWGTWKSPCTLLCKVGFIMDQCAWKSELSNNFHVSFMFIFSENLSNCLDSDAQSQTDANSWPPHKSFCLLFKSLKMENSNITTTRKASVLCVMRTCKYVRSQSVCLTPNATNNINVTLWIYQFLLNNDIFLLSYHFTIKPVMLEACHLHITSKLYER
jgi:hypothetical protein